MGLFGGGGLDTSFAEGKVQKSWIGNKRTHGQLQAYNQPYLNYGSGAFEKLAGLLGVGLPNPYGSRDEFADALRGVYRVKHDRQEDLPLYYDPNSGRIQGDFGIPLGVMTTHKDNFDESTFNDLVDQAWGKINTSNEEQAGYGSLLDPFGLDDFEESPNYQFNLAEGEKALDRAAASRGNYNSPAAMRELLRYSQGLASNEYNTAYNMDAADKSRIYDMLMGASSAGQGAINTQGAMNQNLNAARNLKNSELARLNLASQAADSGGGLGGALGSLGGIAGAAIGGPVGGSIGGLLSGNRASAFGGLTDLISPAGFGLSTGGQGLFSGGLSNMFRSAMGAYGPGF